MYLSPLSERETLLLGDWVVEKARPENRPLWHYALEGRSLGEAQRAMRNFGYYVSINELLYVIGRK